MAQSNSTFRHRRRERRGHRPRWPRTPACTRQTQPPCTRFEASSNEGKAMLKIYAGAVGKMMGMDGTQPGHPLSWLFQWYTHGVKQPYTQPISTAFKGPEIARIYPNAADPNRALAQTMWDTCTHYTSNQQPALYFLPWHRMYVYYFEQIIRSISGKPEFTLPYWSYTDSGHHALPPEFTMENDPVFKPLFRAQRKAGNNNGQPIDAGRPPFLNLNDMKFSGLRVQRAATAFAPSLDRQPARQRARQRRHTTTRARSRHDVRAHGGERSHLLAAPLQHRPHLGERNKAGGANPNDATFKGTTFTFAEVNGKPVQRKVGDVLETPQLNYVYDTYLQRPPGSPPFPRPAGEGSRLLRCMPTPRQPLPARFRSVQLPTPFR